jgi:hypothetical protein
MKKTTLLFALGILVTNTCNAQNVGIGTTTPLARLHVTDSSVVFSASGDIPASPHNTPIEGAGRRMLWYPDKAAFRAGYITGIGWSAGYMGNYSFAAGINTLGLGVATTAFGNACNAGGNYSVAMGNNSITNGIASFAMGENNFVNGNHAAAIGQNNTAGGIGSVAMGTGTSASGNYSTSMGLNNTAGGEGSFAMGVANIANGHTAIAMGAGTRALGDYSTAMGNASAVGNWSTAMGQSTALGAYSISMGVRSIASGDYSTSIGTDVNTNNQSGSFIIPGAKFKVFYFLKYQFIINRNEIFFFVHIGIDTPGIGTGQKLYTYPITIYGTVKSIPSSKTHHHLVRVTVAKCM